MQRCSQPPTTADTAGIDIAFVLLLLQSGVYLLSLVGLLVLALFTHAAAGASLSGLLTLVAGIWPLILAGGLAGMHRWARLGAVTFEALSVLSFLFRVVVDHDLGSDLVTLLTGLALPLLVAFLLIGRGARSATARRQGARPELQRDEEPFQWVA